MAKARIAADDLKRTLGLFGMIAAAAAALLTTVIAETFDRWALANHRGVIWATRRSVWTLPGMPWKLLAAALAGAAIYLWLRYVRERPAPKGRPLDFTRTAMSEETADALESPVADRTQAGP